MMKDIRLIALLAALALMAMGCNKLPVETAADGGRMSFALSVGHASDPATKMTDAIVQNAGESSFRGIEQVYIIPFNSVGGVVAGDLRHGPNVELPQTGLPANMFGYDAEGGDYEGLVYNNNSHLYKSVYFRSGVSSVLTYGKAIDASVSGSAAYTSKARNGSLVPSDLFNAITTDDITFSLEPIAAAGTVEAELEGILTYLNTIAQTSVTVGDKVYRWAAPESYNSAELAAALRSFIFDGHTFAGSALVLNQILTRLYRSVTAISGTGVDAQLASAVAGNINNPDYVTLTISAGVTSVGLKTNFPTNHGVPSGSITLQWDGTEFWRPTSGSGNRAVEFERFCYPPCLWYYVNSPLVISREEEVNVAEAYNSSCLTWDAITSLYTDGSVVGNGTTAVALRDPLQYGVAMLEVTINRTSSDYLPDSKGTMISVANNNFPMTAIIIGEQKNLAFDFTPTGDEQFYLFDSEVSDNALPKNYLSSLATGVSRKTLRVLTVESEKHQNIPVAIEFQNNSGNDFYGHDGDKIVAGGKFYLFAVLKYSDAVNSGTDPLESIFVQDHVTTVSFSVNTLEEAYSTIPEMREPSLSIGVKADVDWILSTPVTIAVK